MDNDKIFLWVGCTSRRFLMDTIRSLEILLQNMGKKLEIIDDEEGCCGSVLFLTGQKEKAAENRERVLKLLREKDIEHLVSTCPGCTRAFKEYYLPRDGSPLKSVEHITEFLADKIDELGSTSRGKVRVTYHDPCHLARHMDVYEAPRKILETLPNVEFTEMKSNRENSFCCGSGGGMRAYNKELADNASALRLLEAQATGAEYLVTSCPFCERSFRSAQEVDERVKDIEVINILDFIRMFLEGESE